METDTTGAPDGASTLTTNDGDASLIAAWERLREARAIYDAAPASDDPNRDYTPEEEAQLDIIDAAEEHIRSAFATTPRGVEIKLWIALQHSLTSQANDEALRIGDLDRFESAGEKLDWIDQLILSAVKSLRAMGARTTGPATFGMNGTVIDRAAWDRAKLLYDARILLGDVDHAIGGLSEAEAAYSRLGADEDDGGAYHRATDAYDDEYGQPGHDAALALILTPAPDIASARLKLEVATFWDIRDEELPKPLQHMIADDVERIAGVRKGGAA